MTTAPSRDQRIHHGYGPAPMPPVPTVWDVPAGLALPPAPPGRTGPTAGTLTAIAVAAAVLIASLGVWAVVALVRAVDDAQVRGSDTTTSPYDGTGSAWSAPVAPATTGGDVTALRGQTVTVGTMQLTAPKLTAVPYLGTVPTKCSTITYTNLGPDAVWIGPLDWTLRSPSGATLSATYADPATELSSGYLAPGTTTTGAVCFATGEPLAGWDLVYASGHDASAPTAVFTG